MNYLQVAEQSSTPKKSPREMPSTDCKWKSRLHLSAQKQPEPSRTLRRYFELSPDSDEEMKVLEKTIKKLHFEENTNVRNIEAERQLVVVSPFEIESPREIEKSIYEPPRKLATKKESYHEKQNMAKASMGLYRLNSMMVDRTNFKAQQQLGDNIFTNFISRRMSSNEEPDDQQFREEEEESRFEQDYQIIQILGKCGTFQGNCFKCLNKLDRMIYFLKEIHLSGHPSEQILRMNMELHTADSDNQLVRFYQTWVEGQMLYMVYEPAAFSIATVNNEKKRLSEKEVRSLLIDVGGCLTWLKEKKEVAHLNLKPQNVLNCRGKFKLMDMVNTLEAKQQLEKSNFYTAPEISGFYLKQVINPYKCDIYSLGLIILENMTDCKYKDLRTMRKMLKCSFHYSPGLTRLILRMTSLNAMRRPTSTELMGFNEMKTEQIKRRLSL